MFSECQALIKCVKRGEFMTIDTLLIVLWVFAGLLIVALFIVLDRYMQTLEKKERIERGII